MDSIADGGRRAMIREALRLLLAEFGEKLASVVVFGSVARGDANPASDVDMLVVNEGFSESLSDRMDRLARMLTRLEKTEGFKRLRRKGVNTWIQFHPLTPDEARLHRPIYLDMVEDGVIVYDRDGFMGAVLSEMAERLRRLGAKRVFLKDGTWYWDLKPDIKRGEVVEV